MASLFLTYHYLTLILTCYSFTHLLIHSLTIIIIFFFFFSVLLSVSGKKRFEGKKGIERGKRVEGKKVMMTMISPLFLSPLLTPYHYHLSLLFPHLFLLSPLPSYPLNRGFSLSLLVSSSLNLLQQPTYHLSFLFLFLFTRPFPLPLSPSFLLSLAMLVMKKTQFVILGRTTFLKSLPLPLSLSLSHIFLFYVFLSLFRLF